MTEASIHAPAVLVVEDDPMIRIDAAMLVEEAGFRVYEAADAGEAISLLEQPQDIRVIFTDVKMPGSMDGLKLAHYLRGRWPPVKIIVTSGQFRPQDGDLPLGGIFLSKPYRAEQVAPICGIDRLTRRVPTGGVLVEPLSPALFCRLTSAGTRKGLTSSSQTTHRGRACRNGWCSKNASAGYRYGSRRTRGTLYRGLPYGKIVGASIKP